MMNDKSCSRKSKKNEYPQKHNQNKPDKEKNKYLPSYRIIIQHPITTKIINEEKNQIHQKKTHEKHNKKK